MVLSDDDLILLAEYMIINRATVRQAAAKFGVSKSGVHSAVTLRLKQIDTGRAHEVSGVLQENREARARRGGLAVWQKKRSINDREVLMV
ncbi:MULTISPECIES: sporulation transcriptional regulator SpoIIID [Oscillospiraceae]|uniref:Sporulation stage III transcriptional regulator SpoIIID n=1 Tax=Pseudobacteroides cellulosolvens ATCC 35603 = DSM 2933 TaxID=398512 RepID=A0A0L6JTB9_9FIRM|nr:MULTISPECIES: sporulation transcriptional regulator SpoIIID [Oscillospiraceae]KNY29063.1 Sporulation stage III transcriptional regulator SpoIIID [Pseudobacteroides cellulosolvens ATCC 35603 = DSM 2933]